MAEAKFDTKPVQTQKRVVVLTLSEQEACALELVLANIGGSTQGTVREYTDLIERELYKLVSYPRGGGLYYQTKVDDAPYAKTAKEQILKLYPE